MDMNDIVLQDDPMCNLKGRDCIEKAVGQDFNCSLSCEGMYFFYYYYYFFFLKGCMPTSNGWEHLVGKKGR